MDAFSVTQVESRPALCSKRRSIWSRAVIPEPTPEALAKTFQQLIPKLWSMGLTGVHDFDKRTCFLALQLLHARGELRFRVVKSIPWDLLSQAVELGLRSGFGDDFLRIGSVKIFCGWCSGSTYRGNVRAIC